MLLRIEAFIHPMRPASTQVEYEDNRADCSCSCMKPKDIVDGMNWEYE
jgi:hypothetical protein